MNRIYVYILLGFMGIIGIAAMPAKSDEKETIDKFLDAWHASAAKADFDGYFNGMHKDFIFLGTDPTERWDKETFATFCKPYFSQGKGWDFKKIERYITIAPNGKMAWFDERIDTWMRDCRGSGVLVKAGKEWKLTQYNLAVLIENDKIKSFIELRDSNIKD